MTILKTSLAIALAAVAAFALAAESPDPLAVVQAAYVDGVHRNADADAMRAGFHDSFRMYVNGDEGVTVVTLDEWAERVAKAGADPQRVTPDIAAELEIVAQSGDAAVVRVELRRDGKHVFTDFLSLYRSADGWKIVAKIYQRHP